MSLPDSVQHPHRCLAHVDRELALRRHRIRVQHRTRPRDDLGNLGHVLHGADLVTRPPDRDQDRLGGDALAQLLRIDAPELIRRHLAHPESLLLEHLADVVDRDVVDLGDDDVLAGAPVAVRVAEKCEVARLGGAGGEDDLLGQRPDGGRDRRAGRLEGRRGIVAHSME